MHTWTLSFIILSSHIFARYMMIIPCFRMIYRDLPIISFIWFISLQNKKSCFVYFSLSETYTESNWPVIFGASFFHREKHPGTWKHTWIALRPKRAQMVRPNIYGTPLDLFRPPIVQIVWSFRPPTYFDLKVSIYGLKELSGGDRRKETETQKRRLYQRRLEGEISEHSSFG
jgi:hypothetical protein